MWRKNDGICRANKHYYRQNTEPYIRAVLEYTSVECRGNLLTCIKSKRDSRHINMSSTDRDSTLAQHEDDHSIQRSLMQSIEEQMRSILSGESQPSTLPSNLTETIYSLIRETHASVPGDRDCLYEERPAVPTESESASKLKRMVRESAEQFRYFKQVGMIEEIGQSKILTIIYAMEDLKMLVSKEEYDALLDSTMVAGDISEETWMQWQAKWGEPNPRYSLEAQVVFDWVALQGLRLAHQM